MTISNLQEIKKELRRICKIKIGQYKSKVRFNLLIDSLSIEQLLILIDENLN